MTNFVKRFIEDNIELIDKGEWEDLFDKWYYEYYFNDRTTDNKYLADLFDTLFIAGIDAIRYSYKARAAIIENEMYQNILGAFKDYPHMKTYSFARCVQDLNSFLYFDVKDLQDILRKAIEDNAMYEFDTEGGYVVKVR